MNLSPVQLWRRLRDLRDDRRSSRDVRAEWSTELERWRHRPLAAARPLVSVCVATYCRPELLTQRCLPSILGQSYDNLEIIVVGDGASKSTELAMREIRDERLIFVNLPTNGPYPEDPALRWMVAGTHAMNKALSLVRGDYVTHLDDDDEYVPERIEKLVAFVRDRTADLVWHPFWYEDAAGAWRIKNAPQFTFGQITTSSVLYCRALACIPWDINAWRLREPGDWNRFRKIRYLRPVMRRFPEPLLRHYRERNVPASG